MPPHDLDLAGLRELQQKIIDSYNLRKGCDVKPLLRDFRHHPANSSDGFIARNLAYIAKKINSIPTKLEIFEQVLQLDPDNVFHLTSYANALIRAKQVDKAIPILEKITQDNPRDFIALTTYGNALIRNNDYPKACEVLEKALKIKTDAAVLCNYGLALQKSGDAKEACAAYQRALCLDSSDHRALTGYAIALLDTGDIPQALAKFAEALELKPNDTTTLNSYANALAEHGNPEKAFDLFERSLVIKKDDTVTLTSYAKALAEHGGSEKAFELFERSLAIEKDNTTTLNSYAKALAEHSDPEKAFDLFEWSLAIEENDTTTLNSYSKALAEHGNPEKAFDLFERSLAIEEKDTTTLTSYAKALAEHGNPEKAFALFERSLAIEENDTTTLNSYAKALAEHGNPEKAFDLFERSLAIEKDDATTLGSYADALIQAEQFTQAFKYLEKAQQVEPRNPIRLATYATALAAYGETQAALDKFTQARQLDPRNILTLTNYGKALAQAERYEEALALFEEVSQYKPDDHFALFLAAQILQILKRPADAVEKLEKIKLGVSNFYNFIRLNIGRLYFQLGRETEGRQQFDYMIKNYRNADAGRLHAAMNIMIAKPYSEDANRMLQEIAESSPQYKEAQRMLSLNLDSKDHFEQFGKDTDDKIQDRAEINRTLYHKIKNRIAVLKETLYDKLLDNDDPQLRDWVEKIGAIATGIKERRAEETAQTQQREDYTAILEIISSTAHDIVDFVGNKISGIREEVWQCLAELPPEDARRALYQDILQHLQRTLAALNDLKAVNEGIRLNKSSVAMQEIFVNWLATPTLRHATIQVHLTEPQRQIMTDLQKLRSFLDELVENSLKHNPGQTNLHLELRADIQAGLPLRRDGTASKLPGQNHYLHISVSDNGKGIPQHQKAWIFQPLTSTSPSNEGSGLGLFGIRRTVEKMRGFIEEKGTQGAHFDIYIPMEDA